MTMNLGNI